MTVVLPGVAMDKERKDSLLQITWYEWYAFFIDFQQHPNSLLICVSECELRTAGSERLRDFFEW